MICNASMSPLILEISRIIYGLPLMAFFSICWMSRPSWIDASPQWMKSIFWISVFQAGPRDNPPRCKTSSALHHITWQQKSSWDQRGKRLLVSQHRLVNVVITLRCYNKGFRPLDSMFNTNHWPCRLWLCDFQAILLAVPCKELHLSLY